jgi:aryl-alcohol dehydrogenase-like predicted oxidoreductase
MKADMPRAEHRMIAGREVFPIALGTMALTYRGVLTEDEGEAIIHAALDLGVNLIDTADTYGPVGEPGASERLIRRALRSWGGDRDQVFIATKGGNIRQADDSILRRGSPAYLRAACESSLSSLGVDCIDLYQLHGPDPQVPIEESVGVLGELRQEGKIRHIGLSNVGRREIHRSLRTAPLISVQNSFSPMHTAAGQVLRACGDLGLAFLCWGPLGGPQAAQLPQLAPRFAAAAAGQPFSPHQLVLAWELSLGPHVIPVVGATSSAEVESFVAAAAVQLTTGDQQSLGNIVY